MIASVETLADRRVVSVEMMYRPRPDAGMAQAVFDFALRSRLNALDPKTDAVIISADSQPTIDSLTPITRAFPALPIATEIVNPPLWIGSPGNTPIQCEWSSPEHWIRYRYSDRWARLDAAFTLASQLNPNSYLLFPAHDAIWGDGLIPMLVAFSQKYAQNGYPAAVSPLSFYRHSAIPGVSIPTELIDLINVAFNRDPWIACRLRHGNIQGFWGKTGLIPCKLGAAIRNMVDHTFLEDDSEIDRAIRRHEAAARAIWIRNPKIYRQVLPAFNKADVQRVIERTLHYSLPAGGSILLAQPDRWLRAVIGLNPRYRRVWSRAQQIIAEAEMAVQNRVTRYGASWFDWGAYRYVVRVGDPESEAWQLE
jgi:hypothetical protein